MARTARPQEAAAETADQGADAAAEHGEDAEQSWAHASAEQAEDPGQPRDRSEPGQQQAMLGWWELLGVSRYAEIGEITASYRALMRQCHPDRFFGHAPEIVAEAERRAKALNLALEQAKAERGSMGQADLSPFGTGV